MFNLGDDQNKKKRSAIFRAISIPILILALFIALIELIFLCISFSDGATFSIESAAFLLLMIFWVFVIGKSTIAGYAPKRVPFLTGNVGGKVVIYSCFSLFLATLHVGVLSWIGMAIITYSSIILIGFSVCMYRGRERVGSAVYILCLLLLLLSLSIPMWGTHSGKGFNDLGEVETMMHSHYLWDAGHLH